MLINISSLLPKAFCSTYQCGCSIINSISSKNPCGENRGEKANTSTNIDDTRQRTKQNLYQN